MDYLQWYVNPVDAVFCLGKMEPDRMWPSGELKEIAIGVPWSDLAKLPWDEVGGKPLGKIGCQHGNGIRIVLFQIEADKTWSLIHGWLMMGALLFNFILLGNFVSENNFNSLKILKRFFGRNVMSCAYSPIICSALPIQCNPIWVSLPLRRPSIAREAARRPSVAREGVARCGKDVAKTWWGDTVCLSCLLQQKLPMPELESERPRRPTLAGRGCVFSFFFPCESPLDLQQKSHENLTKIRLYTHDFDEYW